MIPQISMAKDNTVVPFLLSDKKEHILKKKVNRQSGQKQSSTCPIHCQERPARGSPMFLMWKFWGQLLACFNSLPVIVRIRSKTCRKNIYSL